MFCGLTLDRRGQKLPVFADALLGELTKPPTAGSFPRPLTKGFLVGGIARSPRRWTPGLLLFVAQGAEQPNRPVSALSNLRRNTLTENYPEHLRLGHFACSVSELPRNDSAWRRHPMWRLLAFGAVASITFGLIVVGLTIWRDWRRPLTDKDRARLDG